MATQAERSVFSTRRRRPIAEFEEPPAAVQAFHAQLPLYAPTPLMSLQTLARALGEAFAAAARVPQGVCVQDTSMEGYDGRLLA
ncbi:hypothetical protein HYQ45_001996 [Verticillium longisporum]